MTTTELPARPMDPTRDDRKSAALAAQRVHPDAGAREVGNFRLGRAILRSAQMRQAGASSDQMNPEDEFCPVFFLDGDTHRRRRTAIARFFTPKAISARHLRVMERTTEELLAQVRADGKGRLDELSYKLAVAVAAEIVGLTNSDQAGMAKRIQATLLGTRLRGMHPVIRFGAKGVTAVHAMRFFSRDVRPAIKARREQRQEDVISHLLEEGYPDKAILIECMTYAVAGMVTTREFIVMAAWHLFDDDALRARFTAGDEADQTAILEEILRLEPVAAMLHRRATEDADLESESVKAGELLAVNIRATNVDPETVGACPHALDPDRARRQKAVGAYMSFGDGGHRCPGAQVAITETRVFLDALMRLPDLRLERTPDMTWCDGLMSYELRGAVVTCARS
ncbi:cytochrome P450 [Frankia sp. CNm7]|uniref:Cytochrome P450 n=1 Tax=Frankia nepalensis TaxID=1836974 RepID=A0A937UM19_9ACTN|nr:cytochrome P450 [Frankia nepalensis]MBL7498843.1 cytochrome P450 [Frankia nepalensis]MBL7508648.1 cytochrome P450 [Frankia nepalensis]MBL7521047.1 cytochrome P450 [Frankia nepalensis]MBL7628439.1 cytochrome P450 [Frankia nepalensis]